MKRTKANKGSLGYLKNRKQHFIFKVLLMFLIGLAIYVTGYFLNDESNRNVFTVMAILFVLPGVKSIVELTILLPFKSVDEKRYDRVYELLSEHFIGANSLTKVKQDTVMIPDYLNLLTEFPFTSSEKVMYLDFLVVTNNKIIGLTTAKHQSINYIKLYLMTGLKKRNMNYSVSITDNEDKFLSLLKSAGINYDPAKILEQSFVRERNDLMDYLLSLVVR